MSLLLEAVIGFWYIMLVVFILGRVIYYPNNGKPEFLFTFLMLAAIIAILCTLISRVEFGLGFALGIFAVFSIIRYRTVPISPREMTYIFLAGGIAAKNALSQDEVDFFRILLTDVFILAIAWVSEYFLFRKHTITKLIVYDNLNLIHPSKRELLESDLEQRFGISNIKTIRVGKIDAVKNAVRMMVRFSDDTDSNYQEDN